jgi:hypothetical protein
MMEARASTVITGSIHALVLSRKGTKGVSDGDPVATALV